MSKVFILEPIFKDYLWGGNKLITSLHKNTNINPCAESWELSTHKDGLALVGSGDNKGLTLKEVFIKHPEYLGKYANSEGDLPILIKFIDAKQDLSIQVHPSDEYALKNENSLGKTEVWYILDSDNGHLAVGFKEDVNKDIVAKALNDSTITDYINYFDVKKDEFYPIEAGTVHAIGGGTLLVEIQENSNLTYRLFDYNRKDKDGNLRPLHIDKSLDVLDYHKYNKVKQEELNYHCKYFDLTKITNSQTLSVDKNHFVTLICIDGKCKIDDLEVNKGQCVFVASDTSINIEGEFTLLKVEV